MKVLIVGGGGREHVLASLASKSSRVDQVYCAPGNAGTSLIADNIPLSVENRAGLLKFAKENQIDLTIVGPEAPLCDGIVDLFEDAGLRIFGPRKEAARIEGDKAWAKELMRSARVPTAEARIFNRFEDAREYCVTRDYGLVVKAAGLAAGKGVLVCDDPADAILGLERIMLEREFGEAGDVVVVEEKLQGPEISVLALVDGHTIYVLESSQDHKAVGEGDTGPNTGGMGAYSPAPIADEKIMGQIEREVLVPIVDAMVRSDVPYKGVLYAGLMLTASGPKVLEFNCRFGDPETQAVLPRLKTDFIDVVEAVIDGTLADITLEWDPRPAVSVVMASGGYPGSYEKNKIISGLKNVSTLPDVQVYHAGTIRGGDSVLTSGGRVLSVTALGDTIREACDKAYHAVEAISFDGAFYRKDIAHRAL